MQGKAVSGEFDGTELRVIDTEKILWKQWKAKHPNTLVWSEEGRQDQLQVDFEVTNRSDGYRGLVATDKRLATKDPVFGFIHNGTANAISFKSFTGGARFRLDQGELFLYRSSDDPVERSTTAWFSESGFERIGGVWREKASNQMFDAEKRGFVDRNNPEQPSMVQRFDRGFDTWWYNWSLNNPKTKLLVAK